jgi:hypothetical protein
MAANRHVDKQQQYNRIHQLQWPMMGTHTGNKSKRTSQRLIFQSLDHQTADQRSLAVLVSTLGPIHWLIMIFPWQLHKIWGIPCSGVAPIYHRFMLVIHGYPISPMISQLVLVKSHIFLVESQPLLKSRLLLVKSQLFLMKFWVFSVKSQLFVQKSHLFRYHSNISVVFSPSAQVRWPPPVHPQDEGTRASCWWPHQGWDYLHIFRISGNIGNILKDLYIPNISQIFYQYYHSNFPDYLKRKHIFICHISLMCWWTN